MQRITSRWYTCRLGTRTTALHVGIMLAIVALWSASATTVGADVNSSAENPIVEPANADHDAWTALPSPAAVPTQLEWNPKANARGWAIGPARTPFPSLLLILFETLLTASDGAAGDNLGESVAASGNRIVIGAPGDDVGGAAYVYDYDGLSWIETKLTPANGAIQDNFGGSVAVSGDRVVVGAPGDDFARGSVFVYDVDGTVWKQTKLTAGTRNFHDHFGSSVAVDGDRIVVGSPDDDSRDGSAGAVYVLDYDGASWNETKLTASDAAAGDHFGGSVSVSGDRIVVGALLNDDDGFDSGSAYIFDYDDASWNETKIVADDAAGNDWFGSSVSVHGDRVVVGAALDDHGDVEDAGSIYVFDHDDGSWTPTKLIASNPTERARFGESVSVFGNRVATGAPRADAIGTGAGLAYGFEFDGTDWKESVLFSDFGETGDQIGTSVAASCNRLLFGAPGDDTDLGINAGSAYLWRSRNRRPDADAGEDRTIEATGPLTPVDLASSSTDREDDPADLTYTWTDEDGVVIGTGPTVQHHFALGTHVVTLTVVDSECGSDTDTVSIEIEDTTPPQITLEGDAEMTLECTDEYVEPGAAAFDLVDGDVPVEIGGSVDTTPGEYALVYTAADASGNTAEAVRTVTLAESAPPEISVKSEPIVLWPPNHKYHTVSVDDFVTGVQDQCGAATDVSDVTILSVSSDEPDDTTGPQKGKGRRDGKGSGNTANDVVVQSCRSVDLRAERSGGGNGRVYMITVAASSGGSNVGTASFEVHVPHDRRSEAIADAPVVEVAGLDGCLPGGPAASIAAATPGTDALLRTDVASTPAGEQPHVYSLSQNYPNPFNPDTEIGFALPEAAHVRLIVYDVTGRELARLIDGSRAAGRHTVRWRAGHLPSGIYMYRLTAGSFVEARRMVLLR